MTKSKHCNKILDFLNRESGSFSIKEIRDKFGITGGSNLQYLHDRGLITRTDSGIYCKLTPDLEMAAPTKKYEIIQNIINNNLPLTVKEISMKCGLPLRDTSYRCAYLYKQKKITRVGPEKYCVYDPRIDSIEYKTPITESVISVLRINGPDGLFHDDLINSIPEYNSNQIKSTLVYLIAKKEVERIGPGQYILNEQKIIENISDTTDRRELIMSYLSNQMILSRPVDISNAVGIHQPAVLDVLFQLKTKGIVISPAHGFFGLPGRTYEIPVKKLEIHRQILDMLDQHEFVTADIVRDNIPTLTKSYATMVLGKMVDLKTISRIGHGRYGKFDGSVYKPCSISIMEILLSGPISAGYLIKIIRAQNINITNQGIRNKLTTLLAEKRIIKKGKLYVVLDKIKESEHVKKYKDREYRFKNPNNSSYEKRVLDSYFKPRDVSNLSAPILKVPIPSKDMVELNDKSKLEQYKASIQLLQQNKKSLQKDLGTIDNAIIKGAECLDLINRKDEMIRELFNDNN